MDEPAQLIRRNRRLVTVSLAQLTCGVSGLGVAVRRGHAYDLSFVHGDPRSVRRDAMGMGTALSAPLPMLIAQAVLTAVVARRGSPWAAHGLRVLGGLMVGGYLAERLVRHRLRPAGAQVLETPLVAAGLGLAVAMVVAGGNDLERGPFDSARREVDG